MKTRFKPLLFMFVVLIFVLQASRALEAQIQNQKTEFPAAEGQDSILVFKDAEIRDALNVIAEVFNLNIVMSEDVKGKVNVNLTGASIHNVLDTLLIAHGLDYEIQDNIIRVASKEVLDAEREQRKAKLELEPLVSEVIILHYLDAEQVKTMVQPMLTERGRVAVLQQRTFKGFRFGIQTAATGATGGGAAPTGGLGVRERVGDEGARSNTLMVVDVRRQIEKIKKIIQVIDVAPRQVLIDTKILEVNTNSLEDLGLDFNSDLSLISRDEKVNRLTTDINTGSSNANINSRVFGNVFPASTDAGLHTTFQRLTGEDFTIILHTLLQDEDTKTLSAPKILTVENQEAAILVGEQFPIFSSTVSDQGTATESLSSYLPVGIILQVVCQITPQNEVIMIIHPTVSSVGTMVTGSTGLTQPRITIREADTRVLIKSGQTLVIGGLLQDESTERFFRVPFLSDIPLFGKIFSRKQTDIEQRNLLIFITPQIVEGDKVSLEDFEQTSLKMIKGPEDYVFLNERRKRADQIYKSALQNYQNKDYKLARDQFLQVLSLNSHHEGARKHLEKIKTV